MGPHYCQVELQLPRSVVHRSRRVWRSGISFTNGQRSVKACNVHNAIETPPSSSKTSQAWAERSQVLFGCSCSDKVCDCAGFCGLAAWASLVGLREIFRRCSGFHGRIYYGFDGLMLLPPVMELSQFFIFYLRTSPKLKFCNTWRTLFAISK